MSIVSILCVPVGGAVLRLVSVLYSLMVEKVERLLRGQWSAFNIYGASRCASRFGVSSSRLVFLLVPRLVSRLVHRLVCASCSSVSLLRSVSFVSSRFVFAYCFVVYLVGAFYVVGVSCCSSVSCLVLFLGSLFVPSRLVVSFSWRVTARCGTWAAWAAAMVFSCRHAMLWRWRLVSRVPVGSAGAGR